MPSPFPGMDPYLESAEIFPDVHISMVVRIQSLLNRMMRPMYVARIKVRTYAESENPENDPIEEAYLTIRHCPSKSLIAVLEVVTPFNKIEDSPGQASCLTNRDEAISSSLHWIEIDLLRSGKRFDPPSPNQCDYRVVVARKGQIANAVCWPISLRESLPVIGIPLTDNDADAPIDLAAVFDEVYDSGSYDLSVEYDKPPDPPLDPDDAKWANKLLRAKGLR